MLDYIKDTPEVLNRIIDNSDQFTKQLVDLYQKNGYEGLYIIASGSSYNGSLIAIPFIKHVLNIDVKLSPPFTFENHEINYLGKMMPICISQSGCSTNILSVLNALKENGQKTVCIVGREDCDARNIADLTINWQVGEEKVGFVTKGVSSLACFLMCFAIELAKAMGKIDETKYQKMKGQLKKTQLIQPEMLANSIEVFENNKADFICPSRVILLSSGPGFGVVTEGALKIAETCCIDAFAYEAEEFLHGPIYPSKPEDLILIVTNGNDKASDRMINIAKALEDITSKVYVLTNDERIHKDHRFETSESTCQYTSVLYKLTCLQVIAYLMTENTNRYEPHDAIKRFKKANKVASKSRDNLYLDLQKVE